MARPLKKGLVYFPLDTDFLSDRKIQRLLLQHRSEGITTYLALLCEIYKSHGYYLPMYDELYFDLSLTLRLAEKKVEKIIKHCFSLQLFDSKTLKDSQIITSRSIQERYIEISKRHKNKLDTSFFYPELAVIYSEITKVPSEKTKVPEEETPPFKEKTPTNGNGNENGKENGNKKEKEKKEKEEKLKIILKGKSYEKI